MSEAGCEGRAKMMENLHRTGVGAKTSPEVRPAPTYYMHFPAKRCVTHRLCNSTASL